MNIVVTVTFNRPQIRELATCIARQTLKPDKWIIVNNGGKDPSEYIRLCGVPFEVHECHDTSSVPQAVGWRFASRLIKASDNVVMFDDDDYMPPEYFAERIEALAASPMTYCDVRRYVNIADMKIWEFRIGQRQYGVTSNIAFRGDCLESLVKAADLACAKGTYSVDTYMTTRFAPQGISRSTYTTIPVNLVGWQCGASWSSPEHYRSDYTDDIKKTTAWLGEDLERYSRYSGGFSESDSPLDIIIPLGTGSKSNNDELRMLLRSIAANATNAGRVIIVTQNLPEWVRNVEHVYCGDPLKHNKDGNIINKVLAAISHEDVHGDFVFCADDNVFVKPIRLNDIPVIYNRRGVESFNDEKNSWHERVRRTFALAETLGHPLKWNYECHAPQRFNADLVSRCKAVIDYETAPGYSIYTLFRLFEGKLGGVRQDGVKVTCENPANIPHAFDGAFLSYNDNGFLNGLREKLFERFPDKCRYEK